MEKERRPSTSRVVTLMRRPSDRHPLGGVTLWRCCGDTFVVNIANNSSAHHTDLLVGDLVKEIGGIPCKDLLLPDLEQIITELLRDGEVHLKVKSDQRIVLRRDEHGNALEDPKPPPPQPGKDAKLFRTRNDFFPTVHPEQEDNVVRVIEHATFAESRKCIDVKKSNLDEEAASRGINQGPRVNAATNTECVASYFVRAREFRELLKPQKKTDCREPGNFARNVQIYNSMMSKGNLKAAGKNGKTGEPKPKTGNAETIHPEREEWKGADPTSRKRIFGAALSSVGWLTRLPREQKWIPS